MPRWPFLQGRAPGATARHAGLEQERDRDRRRSSTAHTPDGFHSDPGLSFSLHESDSLQNWYFDEQHDPVRPSHEDPVDTDSIWMCLRCSSQSATWSYDRGSWTCMECSGTEFYNSRRPTKLQEAHGTWVYLPAGSDPQPSQPSEDPPEASKMRRRRRRKRDAAPLPSEPDDGGEQNEDAESEIRTDDPVVDFSNGSRTPSRNVGAASAVHADLTEAVAALSKLVKGNLSRDDLKSSKPSKQASSSDTWNSAQGPAKGVKWRGGAPPQPPAWTYQHSDIRSFERYERKVRIWKLQAKHYMTDAEIGLSLFTSLKGEAELEMEFIDVAKIYAKNGVEVILDQLRQSFQQKSVYVKRQYLYEYESVGRLPQESLRAYVNRYRRLENSLRAIGVDVTKTYDKDSRGSRLLHRARLSQEQQRLVLVGTGQQLNFDAVRSALMMQYPEHRPPPPVAGRGDTTAPYQATSFKRKGKGERSSSSSSSTASTTGGKGYKGHFGRERRAFATEVIEEETAEVEEDHDEADEITGPAEHLEDERNDEAHDEETADLDEPEDDLAQLAQVLTVTARKLAAVTQGRRYSGQPKKSIQDKKRNSVCASCGIKGHWAGDSECVNSQKDSEKGKGKSGKGKKGQDGQGDGGAKKVMTVLHGSGEQTTLEYIPDTEPANPFFAMVCQMPYQVFSAVSESSGMQPIMLRPEVVRPSREASQRHAAQGFHGRLQRALPVRLWWPDDLNNESLVAFVNPSALLSSRRQRA